MRKGKPYLFIFFIAAFCMLQLNVNAQTLTVTASQNQIRIGEQITLQVKMENTSGLVGWVNLPDTFNHIEVIERSKIDTLASGNTVNYLQTITITSFDSGQWQLPVVSVGGITQQNPPSVINVFPVDVSGMQEYHDIKGIEQVEPVNNDWILWVILGVTIFSLLVIYFLYKRKRKPAVAAPILTGDQTPLGWALDELNKLEEQQLWSSGEVRTHFINLVEICRQYFKMETGVSSHYKTTDEWMMFLSSLQGDKDTQNTFFQMLRMADTVKFGKFIPADEDSKQSIETARQMLKDASKPTPDFIFSPPPHNATS